MEAITGPHGVAGRLHVQWPNPDQGRGVNFYQAYLVSEGLVTEIQPAGRSTAPPRCASVTFSTIASRSSLTVSSSPPTKTTVATGAR